MVGCKGQEGFILIQKVKEGRSVSVFKGGVLPKVGTEATLVEYIGFYDSPPQTDEGSPNLGPGFVVKVLEYSGNNNQVARIRIISDDLK